MFDNAALTITLVGLIMIFFALTFVAALYTYFLLQDKKLYGEMKRQMQELLDGMTKEMDDESDDYDLVNEENPRRYYAPPYDGI